jgi:hypothetical protein
MQSLMPKPLLRSFRALAFHGENRGVATGAELELKLQQDIQVGLAVPTIKGGALQCVVLIKLQASTPHEKDLKEQINAVGEYEAKFFYDKDVQESTASELMETDDYQYLLIAQVFPLAMTHFRREMQSMGLDARHLPLGFQPQTLFAEQ